MLLWHFRLSSGSEDSRDAPLKSIENFPSWYFLFFYKQVGKKYLWTDWLEKSKEEIDQFVNDKQVLLYTLIKDGLPCGFYMLD